MRFRFAALPFALACFTTSAFADDAAVLRRIYDEALTNSRAYEHLRQLTSEHPARLSGSRNLAGAITWAERTLRDMKLDRVWTQDVMVPHWERGAPESARLHLHAGTNGDSIPLNLLALGGSAATPPEGLLAEVIEVHSLEQLAQLGRERIEGRIVFFNRPMDPRHVETGNAYGAAIDQRSRGPFEAAKYGAVAALVRSLTLANDDHPHTGTTAYREGHPTIPCAALGIQSANTLSAALAREPAARVKLKIHARWLPDAPSHNVIGELRGTEFPDQIIVVAGHIDSWDVSPGAHDDGAGVVQSIEVLRLFQALGLRPRHTVRCVLFTNEENGLRGATAYATHVKDSRERHVLAIESDAGGLAPRGFELGSTQGPVHERAARWRDLFEPYGIHVFRKGTGGADVAPLMMLGATVGDLVPDSQRYFDYHHTRIDTFEAVHRRELELGAAALASLVYLVDTHGL
jgi:carboxypeptidase Q